MVGIGAAARLYVLARTHLGENAHSRHIWFMSLIKSKKRVADQGTQYMSHDFQNEIRWLGMTSSSAFVRAPEGNGCAERFIRTFKENLLWVRTFETVEDLRQALLAFQRRYNEEWLIQRHGYRSPAQFRRDLEAALPAAA